MFKNEITRVQHINQFIVWLITD